MEDDKAAARFESLNKVWAGIIEGRRWQIQQVYGPDAAERYHALNKEKQYFVLNGHLPSNPNENTKYEAAPLQDEIEAHHRDFMQFCDVNYGMQRKTFEDRIERNRRNAMAQPLYQKQQRDRDELAAYIESQNPKANCGDA